MINIATEPIPLTVDPNGVIRVAETRVTLDSVVLAFLDGATAEEIAQQYPTIDLADVYAVIGYYLKKQPEIEAYLKQRQKVAEKIRKKNESRFPSQNIRARLLARKRS